MKWAILSFLLLVLASCQNKDRSLDPTLTGFFPEDTGEVRKPNQFADAMAASGARSDGTLSRHHFDGAALNSLGEEKLALMLKDGAAPAPLTVYLNLDEKAAEAKGREASVVDFLKDKGLSERQIAVVYGYNPAGWSPASGPLSKLKKTETGDAGGGQGDYGGAAGGATGGAGGGGAAGGSGGGSGAGGGLFSDSK
ncbi:MAG: hypothetical protein JWN40_346 [Phycisphaerales bacterium]|nr:hypothetical protein [Phycisphaerales bacterium]